MKDCFENLVLHNGEPVTEIAGGCGQLAQAHSVLK
jgi:hypothetical protein